jgi:pilus assembly protein Flp/PilA
MNIPVKLEMIARNLRIDRRAVTAIEYALIASLLAVAVVSGATLIGTSLKNTFTYLAGQI